MRNARLATLVIALSLPAAPLLAQNQKPKSTDAPRKSDPAKAAAPNQRPVLKGIPGAKKVDRTSAKAVVVAFATALVTGDKLTASDLTAGTPKQLEYLDAQVDDYVAYIRFDALLSKKFGEDADFYLSYYDKTLDYAKKAEVKMEGPNKADVTLYIEEAGRFEGWELVKRDGQWSIVGLSIWDPEVDPTDTADRLRKHVKATNNLTRRMAAGEFGSVEAAMEAWEAAHEAVEEGN